LPRTTTAIDKRLPASFCPQKPSALGDTQQTLLNPPTFRFRLEARPVWIHMIHRVIRDCRSATRVAQKDLELALKLLEKSIREVQANNDQAACILLYRHAGVISYHAGDLGRALRFYEQARQSGSEDAYLYLAIGDIYRRIGNNAEAHAAFTHAGRLGAASGDSDVVKMASEADDQLDLQ